MLSRNLPRFLACRGVKLAAAAATGIADEAAHKYPIRVLVPPYELVGAVMVPRALSLSCPFFNSEVPQVAGRHDGRTEWDN